MCTGHLYVLHNADKKNIYTRYQFNIFKIYYNFAYKVNISLRHLLFSVAGSESRSELRSQIGGGSIKHCIIFTGSIDSRMKKLNSYGKKFAKTCLVCLGTVAVFVAGPIHPKQYGTGITKQKVNLHNYTWLSIDLWLRNFFCYMNSFLHRKDLKISWSI